MSPKDWAVCPSCRRKAEQEHAAAKQALDDSYGAVTLEKFRELEAELSDLYDKTIDMNESMREDYQLGFDGSGEFYVYYRASCADCGFEFVYDHQQPVDANEQPE